MKYYLPLFLLIFSTTALHAYEVCQIEETSSNTIQVICTDQALNKKVKTNTEDLYTAKSTDSSATTLKVRRLQDRGLIIKSLLEKGYTLKTDSILVKE